MMFIKKNRLYFSLGFLAIVILIFFFNPKLFIYIGELSLIDDNESDFASIPLSKYYLQEPVSWNLNDTIKISQVRMDEFGLEIIMTIPISLSSDQTIHSLKDAIIIDGKGNQYHNIFVSSDTSAQLGINKAKLTCHSDTLDIDPSIKIISGKDSIDLLLHKTSAPFFLNESITWEVDNHKVQVVGAELNESGLHLHIRGQNETPSFININAINSDGVYYQNARNTTYFDASNNWDTFIYLAAEKDALNPKLTLIWNDSEYFIDLQKSKQNLYLTEPQFLEPKESNIKIIEAKLTETRLEIKIRGPRPLTHFIRHLEVIDQTGNVFSPYYTNRFVTHERNWEAIMIFTKQTPSDNGRINILLNGTETELILN